MLSFLSGNYIDLFLRIDSAKFDHHRNEFRRKQLVDRILELSVMVFFKITQDSLIELLYRQCRFQVDFQCQWMIF